MVRLFSMTLTLAATAMLVACTAESTTESSSTDTSADDALAGLQTCKSQALACQGDALLPDPACAQALHQCLQQLVPKPGDVLDAGSSFDRDAAAHHVVLPPIVHPPIFDAAPRFDAAPHFDASRIIAEHQAVDGCLQDVATCLKAGTQPLMCLEQGRTCLQGVIAAKREGGIF